MVARFTGKVSWPIVSILDMRGQGGGRRPRHATLRTRIVVDVTSHVILEQAFQRKGLVAACADESVVATAALLPL